MARVEIDNEEDLERWLNSLPEDRQQQVAAAIACRAALRVFPGLNNWLKKTDKVIISIILNLFHAHTLFWYIIKWPYLEEKVDLKKAESYAFNAASAAYDETYDYDPRDWPGDHPASEAFHIAESTRGAIGSLTGGFSNDIAREFKTSIAYADYVEGLWESVLGDIDTIAKGKSPQDLIMCPLWPQERPKWVEEDWSSMKHRLLARKGEHWEVWTNWYDARLDPSKPIPCYSPPVPELERARVLLPEDLWKQGPATVNAKIKRLIEEHDCSKEIDPPPPLPSEDEQPQVPEQVPATIMPVWDGDRLVLSDAPVDAEGLDRELLTDTLRAMREQLFALAEKLQMDQSSNAIDPRIIEALRDTAKLIPDSGEIPRHRLIRLAEEVEELEAYLTDPDNEEREGWPDILRTKATKLVQNLSRLLNKFRPWRETHQHLQEEAAKVDEQTLERLPEEAEAFAEDLQEQFEPEKLDPRIPQLLREMGQRLVELRDAMRRRGKAAFQRAADLVESIGNILKRITSRVVKWLAEKGKKFAKHLDEAIDNELKKFAQFLARWGRRLLQGSVGGGMLGGGGYLAHKFGWLTHVINWLHNHFPWLFS